VELGEEARGFREIACETDSALAIACGLIARQQAKRSNGELTRREREVLQLVSQGLSNQQIARTLWIAESTVKVHVRHLFEKLGVQSRTEAAAMAAEVL
jgi:DNA-binding NarL/FixJ family response regulator